MNGAKEIKRIKTLIQENTRWFVDSEKIKKLKALEKQRDKLLRIEETRRQKSRANWLKDGDRNTWFFHSKAYQRRKTNAIKKLRNNEGK